MKSVKRSLFGMALGVAAILSLGGCTLIGEVEKPTDMTLSELQARRREATDPSGAFADAKSFVQRQVVTSPSWFGADEKTLVETRFLKPDHFQVVTLLDNRPASAVVYNGEKAFLVDYRNRKVFPIEGEDFEMIRTGFQLLGTPDGDWQEAFEDIQLKLVEDGGVEYYKLACTPRSERLPRFDIYVDAQTFLVKRIRTPERFFSSGLDYDTVIDSYSNYDDVIIPQKWMTTVQERTEESHLMQFQLNTPLRDADFEPPKF